MPPGGSQTSPIVTTGIGNLTVTIPSGTAGAAIQIVIFQDGIQVTSKNGTLGADGKGTWTFNLPAGTYDVQVTVPFPNGTVWDFPNEVVN